MAYNILIVDDSTIVRQVLIKSLKMAGIEMGLIHEAGNGREGLEILDKNWVDLIFLDINMPIMNGLEFMEHLRSKNEFKLTPVIVVSTEANRERKAQLADKDVQAYLRKPVTPEELTKTIKDILGGSSNEHF